MSYLLLRKILIITIFIDLSMGETTNRSTTCSLNEGLCGSSCYSMITHKCFWNLVCRKEEGACANVCYNLTTQRCFWGLICRKEERWCANKCFNPSTQQCSQGKLIDINI